MSGTLELTTATADEIADFMDGLFAKLVAAIALDNKPLAQVASYSIKQCVDEFVARDEKRAELEQDHKQSIDSFIKEEDEYIRRLMSLETQARKLREHITTLEQLKDKRTASKRTKRELEWHAEDEDLQQALNVSA